MYHLASTLTVENHARCHSTILSSSRNLSQTLDLQVWGNYPQLTRRVLVIYEHSPLYLADYTRYVHCTCQRDHVLISHMYQLNGFGKSTPTQNRQLHALIRNSEH